MFKVLKEGCEPTKGSKYSACVDLYASEDVVIDAGSTKVIGLGVCIDLKNIMNNLVDEHREEHDELFDSIPEVIYDYQDYYEFMNSHYLQLMLRSSLGKKGLNIPNGVGVIDLDYKDEIKVLIHNPICFTSAEGEHDYLTHCKSGADDRVRYTITKGEKIAQIILLEHQSYLFGIDTEEERVGGFGSTDNNKMRNE